MQASSLGEAGTAEAFSVRIDELTFSGGETVEPEESSLLILIGPNSCGKSTALREVQEHFGVLHEDSGATNWKVVEALSPSHVLDKNSLVAWLDEHFTSSVNNRTRQYHNLKGYGRNRSTLSEDRLERISLPRAFSDAKDFYTHLLDAGSRLNIVNPPESIDVHSDPHQHYFHSLQANDDLREEISEQVREAFKKDLMINWTGGQKVPVHVGKRPEVEGDRVSEVYGKALAEEPKLHEEGDGIKSFVGCLLAVRCAPHEVLLIDEPEAFLHPPQARRLGKILAESAGEGNRQIIAATHSSDVVRGAVSSNGRVSICRLNRNGDVNHANQISSSGLEELWDKPLLKSSGAVEGIFHRGVVVCEGDSDARFYESLLIRLEEDGALSEPADLHFIHGGSKGELPYLAESYRRLKVPVVAIADFDILRNENDLERTVEALGGELSEVQGLYNSVSSALSDLAPSKSTAEVIQNVRDHLGEVEPEDDSISGGTKRKICNLLDDGRDWSEPKKHGINTLSGGANEDCQKLLERLQEWGLFVVPEGEMEKWDRSLSSSKSKWIKEALQKVDQNADVFGDAKAFMKQVGAHLGVAEPDEA